VGVLNEINQAGLIISLAGEQLNIANPKKLTDGLRNLIRTNKQDIVRQLSTTNAAKANELLQDIRDQIEERVAIMEFDAGLSRHDAEQAAIKAIRVYCYRVKEKPDSELVAIMPNASLSEAHESLRLRYGNRLLAVYEKTRNLAGILV
jgi:ArsR family metal-binding transcriptional regulator